jgi:PTH2 family peptidyl-tRNA hydrolase
MIKQVIVVRKDLNMGKGKLAAQVAHASMAFLTSRLHRETTGPAILLDHVPHRIKLQYVEQDWIDNSFTKVVLWCNDEAEFHMLAERADQANLCVHKIQDEGRTEFEGPTWTAFAIGPDESEVIDHITGHLKLVR